MQLKHMLHETLEL